MTKLEELIKELCPNGVEYKRLKDCSIMERGTAITQKQIRQGDIPVIAGGKKPAYYCDKSNREGETITVAGSGAYAGYLSYWDTPIFVSDAFSIKGKENVLTKYLYYCLNCKQQEIYNTKKGGGVPHVHISSIESLQIPLPPLAVQCEIVRILDDFTLLSAELAAELAARCKQYEYYRDKLLSFDKLNVGYELIPLADLATFTYGFTATAKDSGELRFIRITDINDNGCLNPNDAKFVDYNGECKKYLLSKGDLLLARTGATYGKTLYYLGEAPAVYASFLIKITLDNTKILNRYYWHFSKSSLYWEQANRYVSKGGQQQFNVNAVSRILVPVSPLGVQEKVVETLDKFDKLCNDLSEGLPAEIEARQKQYEYYRDKLLTFQKE